MKETLLRGRTLTFLRWPDSTDDTAAYRYEEDGALLIRDGKIVAAGPYAHVKERAGEGVTTIDHRPYLLLPGFIDGHAHFPQMQIIASYGAELLDWLNKYTFPEETKFNDTQHGRRIARLFLDELVRHGTTTVAAYCSVHKESAETFFAEAHERNMLTIAGKVMMDRNAPDGLRDTPQSGYDDSKALIREWHGKGRQLYAVTPRFAITSTPEQMEMAGALMREHPELHMQTHLSENHAEIAFTQELYPWSRDYTDVYEHYGLLGPKALIGHCIHLSEREADALSASRSVAVFCPTSNLFLGSGLFDYQRYRKRGQTDSHRRGHGRRWRQQLFDAADDDEGYKVIALNGEKLNPFAAFWQITRGNAEALPIAGSVGTLEAGTDADIAVSNPGRRQRCGCAWKPWKLWPRNFSCCKRSATIVRFTRSMSRGDRQRVRDPGGSG